MPRPRPPQVFRIELMHDQLDTQLHVFVELAISFNIIHWIFVEVDELQVRKVMDVRYLDDLVLTDVEVR